MTHDDLTEEGLTQLDHTLAELVNRTPFSKPVHPSELNQAFGVSLLDRRIAAQLMVRLSDCVDAVLRTAQIESDTIQLEVPDNIDDDQKVAVEMANLSISGDDDGLITLATQISADTFDRTIRVLIVQIDLARTLARGGVPITKPQED